MRWLAASVAAAVWSPVPPLARLLRPGDTGGGLQAPTPAVGAGELDGYPAVHLGRAGQTDRHPMLAWWMNQRRTGIILCLENSCSHESEVSPDGLTIASVGGNSRSMSVTAWVPADTAVVGLTVDNQAQVWQRPVARTVQIEFDPMPGEVDFNNPGGPADSLQVTAYDADGNVLAETTHPIL